MSKFADGTTRRTCGRGTGDGYDTIKDSDGVGHIEMNGATLNGGVLTVENYITGQLGLTLEGAPPVMNPGANQQSGTAASVDLNALTTFEGFGGSVGTGQKGDEGGGGGGGEAMRPREKFACAANNQEFKFPWRVAA